MIYVVVQLIAGVAAGFSYYGLYGKTFFLEPSSGYSWGSVFVVEAIYTFMYCFVVLNTACTQAHHGNQFFGMAIGFVTIAGGYAVGGISGGAFNPAVALGIDVPSAGLHMGWSLWYLLFEVFGAFLAAGLFRFLRPGEFSADGIGSARSMIPRPGPPARRGVRRDLLARGYRR